MIKSRFVFQKKSKITILTGAGISAESGIKTFRDANGLWENHKIEEVASPKAFSESPQTVWRFYKQRYFQLSEVKPNPAHFALKRLEQTFGDNFTLITQNVDGLHKEAGSKNVLEMHGNLHHCFCSVCFNNFLMKNMDLTKEVPICPQCNGFLRPDIVWFGEMPYFMDKIENALTNCDYFIVIGTSGVVYPAAQFLAIARHYGARTIGINKEKPANYHLFDEFFEAKAGELLPELVSYWSENV